MGTLLIGSAVSLAIYVALKGTYMWWTARRQEKDIEGKEKSDKKDKKAPEKKSGRGWDWWVGSIITVGAAGAVIAVAIYFIGSLRASMAESDKNDAAFVRYAERQEAEFKANALRSSPSLTQDTTFVVAAKRSGTGWFVLGHGCQVRTKEVNPSHSYVFEDNLKRYEVMAGKKLATNKSPEYFSLSALGGPVTEIKVTIYGCPESNAKSPTSRGS